MNEMSSRVDEDDWIAVVGALADSEDDVLGDWRARGRPEDAVTRLVTVSKR